MIINSQFDLVLINRGLSRPIRLHVVGKDFYRNNITSNASLITRALLPVVNDVCPYCRTFILLYKPDDTIIQGVHYFINTHSDFRNYNR